MDKLLSHPKDEDNSSHPIKRANYSMRSNNADGKRAGRYQAYLLRIWREDESMQWHAQLEDPHTNEIISFATLTKLLIFLDEHFSIK